MQENQNNKRSIIKPIVVTIIILAIIAGTITGGVIYLKNNKDKLEWNLITFPWEKKDFMWPWEQGNYTEEEKEKIRNEEETVIIGGLLEPVMNDPGTLDTSFGTISIDSIKLDKKGYEIDMNYYKGQYNPKEPVSVDINKIIIDGFDLLIDKFTIEKSSNKIIQISRPKFELYNKNGISNILIYYKERDSTGAEHEASGEIKILNKVTPSAKIGKRINIDRKETANGNIELYYWKKIEDDNNTYLYFYVDNKLGKKTISVKKLLINDKLYDYSSLNEEFFPNSIRGFALKIPKKDVKKVKKINVTFFIKTAATKEYGEGVYLSSEYSATIKD